MFRSKPFTNDLFLAMNKFVTQVCNLLVICAGTIVFLIVVFFIRNTVLQCVENWIRLLEVYKKVTFDTMPQYPFVLMCATAIFLKCKKNMFIFSSLTDICF